jgi:hypothetical protein
VRPLFFEGYGADSGNSIDSAETHGIAVPVGFMQTRPKASCIAPYSFLLSIP